MKKLALALMMSAALIVPNAASAANVTVQVDMKSYSGPNAYLAVYLVDGAGNYDSTLWVAGTHYKYLRHLRGWARGFSNAGDSLDGVSGASVGGGRTLKVSANLADALIDSGYKVVVDTSVEHWGDYTADASADLASGGSTSTGSGFVNRLSVSF